MRDLDVYYDYISPFAYIAAEVLPAFALRLGVTLHWKPIEMERLSNYDNGLPYSEVKRRYVVVDAMRTAQFHNVEIQVPKPHPVDSMMAMRLAVVAGDDARFLALHRALFRAAWREQRSLADVSVLEACIEQAGGAGEPWLAQAHAPETADLIKANTQEAEVKGIFGVPSILLGSELFWGIDCLPTLEWRIEQSRAGSPT